jgi:c-di-GMP-related signal transduction protein
VQQLNGPRSSVSELANGTQRFVARQPIFDRSRKVIGYELLFRAGVDEYFRGEGEQASRSTLDTSVVLGLDTLCNGRLAFINCTAAILVKESVTLLPPNQVVIEIVETVEPNEQLIGAIRKLRASGFTIALDNFSPGDHREKLVEFADLIKVDVRTTTTSERSSLLADYRRSCELLAARVETQEEFREAYEMGFSQFQGYFFRHPELMAVNQIPAHRLTFLRLLELVSHEDLDIDELEKVIKQDANICYRLLRYLNSAAFGFRNEVRSIRQAITILGERELRRWVRLLVTLTASSDKSGELVIGALTRARFCELISQRLHCEGDLFLLGLLSLMDAILGIPMEVIVEHIPLDEETKTTLKGQSSAYQTFYQLVLAQESGDWAQCSALAGRLKLSEADASTMWWQAAEWAQQIRRGTTEEEAEGRGAGKS